MDEMLSALHNALGAIGVGSREEPQSTDGVDSESGWLVDVDMELEATQRGLNTRFVCPQKGRKYEEQAQAVPISDGVFLPVLASRPPGASIDLAVVAMHGKPRDYEEYFRKTLVAINEQPGCGAFRSSCRILSIVPVFPDEPCTAHAWSGGSSKVEAPIWSTAGKVQQWAYGGFSDPGSSSNGTGLGGIPSFAAYDAVLEWVTNAYPTVRAVVASGYSAGGQMIQRWSVLSAEGAYGVTRLGVPLRIVVGAPSSVLYLDSTRPAQRCSPEKNTGPHHVCTSFSVPKENCNGYDEYGHGLGNIQGSWASAKGSVTSGASTYLFSSLSSAGDWQSALLDRFATKNIRYFVGELDTVSCIVGACDGSCASMLTGSNRLQRLQNFVSYLQQVFGPGKPQHLSLIPGTVHVGGGLPMMQMELPEWVAWSNSLQVSWYCKESATKLSHYPVCDKSCEGGSAICCSSPARSSEHEAGSRCLVGDGYQVDDALCGEPPALCEIDRGPYDG